MAAEAVGAPIVAVASRSSTTAAERAAQVGARAVDPAQLPAGADAVIVCTPPDRHLVEVEAALDAGRAVLVETPLTSTLAAADRLVARGGPVLYGEYLAHSPLIAIVRERIGDIGTIGYAEIRLLSPRPTWGSYLDPDNGGGVLFHLGTHAIALALLLVDDRPVSVQARVESSTGLDVDDRAEVWLRSATGTTTRLEIDWRSTATIWDVQVSSETDVLRADLLPAPDVEHNGDEIALPRRHHEVDAHLELLGHVAQLQDLARIVAGGRPDIDVAFGRTVLEIVCAAYRSAHTGVAESLPFDGPRDRTPIAHWKGRQ